ncbi:MAG: hypothetical protein FD129_660, partial [bacterium]
MGRMEDRLIPGGPPPVIEFTPPDGVRGGSG